MCGKFSFLRMAVSIQEILLIASLGIIVLWTARLAYTKGMNPWFWGAGALILISLAWFTFGDQFLAPVAMAPLIFLLLFRSPLFRRNRQQSMALCPRCGTTETGRMHFCVQCGWDLSQSAIDVGEVQDEVAGAGVDAGPTASDRMPADADSTPRAQPYAPPQTESTPTEPNPTPTEPVVQPEPALETPVAPQPTLAQEATAAPEAPVAPTLPPVTPAAKPARPRPTAANLTERGIELFNQGRFQEAIDQFTKAIALDPGFREAWERRAEAYGRTGRPERQKADQSQLEAI